MYNSTGKLGRGRGGGPAKRSIHSTFQPPSIQRPSATPGGGRLSAGGGHRNSSNNSAAPATVSTAEEAFSLVRNNPLNFGMIIRLSPVLVEEIKRLEAQGGAARMKFDSSANNPAGNVIDVGGKEFRFTWSQETGDLCDIYEERRSGDRGDGLLVESGGAWRKLNVQRELDDSVKNHVKMRTVEAERKHKSRKAIILDHGNPSMKNPMILAAAEANNTWRGSYKQKKEPPLKRMKAEPCAVIPPKSFGKGGISSSKLGASASPLLSTQEQSGVPLSPLRNTNLTKVHANREEATSTQENASTSEKEMLTKVPAGVVQNKLGSNERSGFGNKPPDLQSLLISLLMEKPHGMNLKALEKAIGETIPKSVKQIEPILKKIAVFQAPGRYILKPDVELGSFRKSLSESGSSPENNKHRREISAPESSFPMKADSMKEFEEPTHQFSEPYEEINTLGKIDIDHVSSDVLSDKKVSHNSAGSSSLSGSDSDSESDSSDSGSDSRSPVGSGSGSSSDSESDASSNSKQGSDEDVDIMSDDDKEPKQKLLLQSDTDTDVGYGHNIVNEKDDVHGFDSVELEKDLFGDNHEADTNSFPDKDGDSYADDTNTLFLNHLEHQESEAQARKSVSKRASDEKEHAKRFKSANWTQLDGPGDGPDKGNTTHMTGRNVRDYDYEKIDNHGLFGNPTLDSLRSIDLNAQAKAPADVDNVRFSEKGPQGNDVFFIQKDNKSNKETRDEDGQHFNDRRPPKNSRLHSGSHQTKHVPSIEKVKESVSVSTSQIKDSPIDVKKSPVINGRAPTLRRELSDLELGEFRENLHEASGPKNRFERNNSLKQSENKSTSDYWNLDESKGKVAGRTSLDSAKVSPLKKVIHKGRHIEPGVSQGIGSEGYMDTQRKLHMGVPHKHEKQVVPLATKDKKRHKSKDLGEKKKDFWLVDSSRQKKREMEACSDDSITLYTKYEKDEPEMKGPIRDLSQYSEYVQEYREKYDCYHTLNKILESYRSEFQTYGRDLEHAKGRDNDRYNKILEQLMESYRQCGMKHKRLKKIFVVLHHELQHLKEMIRDFAEKQTKG